MFVLISTLVSVAILAAIYHFASKREQEHERQYQLLTLLRDVAHLCRRHRAVSHYSLKYQQNHDKELEQLRQALTNKLHLLVETSKLENRTMYRVLQLKIKKLLEKWSNNSVARNQMEHGKLIRHTLYLMDEVTLAWLAMAQRDELHDEYHINWQTVIDSLETLTQLRIGIPNRHDHTGKERMQHYASVMLRRLNQLAVISPLSIASPMCSHSIQALSEYVENEAELGEEELYDITSDISLAIFNTYDHLLSDIIESLYIPLPRLSIA
jgi:hypothetical protein